jgi:hypothetical protein
MGCERSVSLEHVLGELRGESELARHGVAAVIVVARRIFKRDAKLSFDLSLFAITEKPKFS